MSRYRPAGAIHTAKFGRVSVLRNAPSQACRITSSSPAGAAGVLSCDVGAGKPDRRKRGYFPPDAGSRDHFRRANSIRRGVSQTRFLSDCAPSRHLVGSPAHLPGYREARPSLHFGSASLSRVRPVAANLSMMWVRRVSARTTSPH